MSVHKLEVKILTRVAHFFLIRILNLKMEITLVVVLYKSLLNTLDDSIVWCLNTAPYSTCNTSSLCGKHSSS
jgi:hypothetical protein